MIREIGKEKLREIYSSFMMEDFPDDELKPCEMIEEIMDQGNGIMVAFYPQEKLSGYAFLIIIQNVLLMDYFAIVSGLRNQGLGSIFLKEIGEYFKDYDAVYVESEDNESDIAQRRIAFYKKAGFHEPGIHINLYFVDYTILLLPLRTRITNKEAEAQIHQMYEEIYPQFINTKYLIFK